jgi:hypothetical protein
VGTAALTSTLIASNIEVVTGLRRARWLGAVLIAPLLAFALAATGHLALRCTITGVVMPDACCPPPAESEAPRSGGHDAIGEPACCERFVIETGKIPAVFSERSADLPIASVALAAPSSSTLVSAATLRRHVTLRVAEPRFRAAHFLLSHSFLI